MGKKKSRFPVGDVIAINMASGLTVVGVAANKDQLVLENPLDMVKRSWVANGGGFSFQKHAFLNNDSVATVTFSEDNIVSIYVVDDKVEKLYHDLVEMYSSVSTKIDMTGMRDLSEPDDDIDKFLDMFGVKENDKIDIDELRKTTVRLNDDEDNNEEDDEDE